MARIAQIMPYEVPHAQVELISKTFSEIEVLGTELSGLISTLRKTGNSGLVFHDPVSGDKIQVLANVNETLMAMLQEASDYLTVVRYDPKTSKIMQPDFMINFGASVFSATPVWGSNESRTLDHNDAKSAADWSINAQTTKTKRTFTVGPVSGLFNAHHMADKEEDRVSAMIIEKLSVLTGLKGKLNSQCCHNARLDRYACEGEKKAAEKKAAEANNVTLDATKDKVTESKVQTAIRTFMANPKSEIRKLPDLRIAANREILIEHLMGLENCFITPYREYLTKDDEPVLTWKVETSRSIGAETNHRAPETFNAEHLANLWNSMGMVRKYELKPQLHYKLKQELDMSTPLQDVDKYTADWCTFAVSKGIRPNAFDSVRILDETGALVKFTGTDGSTREPNYNEYAAMCVKSRWQNAIMLVAAKPNAKDGVYANTQSAIMVLPSNYVYKLRSADKNAPSLKLPFTNLLNMMVNFTGNRPRADVKVIAAAETDMDCVYSLTAQANGEDEGEHEPSTKKQRTGDSPPTSPEMQQDEF